jgi:peptide deformylase
MACRLEANSIISTTARWRKHCARGVLSVDLSLSRPYLRDMSILPILEVPDPRLKTISTPVEAFDADLKKLVDDMFETMYAAPGIGLAAIQVGVPKRLLVIDLQDEGEDGEVVRNPRIFVNPEILDPSEDHSIYNEGCLSVPDQYAEVERPAAIRARWQDLDGKTHEEPMTGMMATCLQHEMDHLEGILFIDHLSRLKRQMVLKKIEKNRKLGGGHVHGEHCNH